MWRIYLNCRYGFAAPRFRQRSQIREILFRIMHDPNVCAPSRFRQRPQMPEKYFFVLRAIRTCALLRDPGSDSRCQKNTLPYHFQSERMRCFPLRLHPHCIRAWGEKKIYIYIHNLPPSESTHFLPYPFTYSASFQVIRACKSFRNVHHFLVELLGRYAYRVRM